MCLLAVQPELTSVGSDHIQNEDEGIEEDHKESSDDKANEETTTQVKNEVIEDPGKSTNEKLKKEKKKHKETLDKDDLQEKKVRKWKFEMGLSHDRFPPGSITGAGYRSLVRQA